MLPELKEFLAHLAPGSLLGLQAKSIFVRSRVAPEIKLFTAYLYAQGSSLRRLKELLCDLGARVSHAAIWKWIQKLGQVLKEHVFRRKRRRCLVVDETKVSTRKGQIWVFAAIDPENREIVGVHTSKYRESIDVLQFLKRCLRYCEGKPVLISDGGPWYRWPAQRLGLKHMVVCSKEHNYIERWFETFKDRLRVFDCYFPTQRLETVQNFATVFCFWYNKCRQHMSLGWPPGGGEGGSRTWMEVLS